jgi:hypothetical protein
LNPREEEHFFPLNRGEQKKVSRIISFLEPSRLD